MDGDEQGEGREGEDKRRSTRKGSDLLQIPAQKATLYLVSLDSGSEESQYTNQLRPLVSSLLEIRKWYVNNITYNISRLVKSTDWSKMEYVSVNDIDRKISVCAQ